MRRGLGRASRAYAGDGWDVIATYRDIANRWGEDGAIRHLTLDVTRPSISPRSRRIGVAPSTSDLNAAIAIDPMRLRAIDYEFAARILDVNTIGPLRLVEAFVDNVAASRHGKIALISSRMGSIGSNLSGSGTPIAPEGWPQRHRPEPRHRSFKRGVLVMLLHPGGVKTRGGGPRAALEIPDSIAAMRKLIARLGSHETGQFYTWEGVPLPW
jgi:NADP-dependent 3-hydroxy acid dehydrogenase YdfG